VKTFGLVRGSLSAVSEAPTNVGMGVETLCRGRFRYSDLKEAAPRVSLWGLYGEEPVPIVCEVSVAVGALRFQLVIALRMVVGGALESLNCTSNRAFGGM
jgi:hypothetical protein